MRPSSGLENPLAEPPARSFHEPGKGKSSRRLARKAHFPIPHMPGCPLAILAISCARYQLGIQMRVASILLTLSNDYSLVPICLDALVSSIPGLSKSLSCC